MSQDKTGFGSDAPKRFAFKDGTFAEVVNLAMNKAPLGYQQITSLAAATGLTVPSDGDGQVANLAMISPQTQPVRWRDDGTNPTAAIGYPLGVGQELVYDGNLTAIKFIEQSASAALNISYYRA